MLNGLPDCCLLVGMSVCVFLLLLSCDSVFKFAAFSLEMCIFRQVCSFLFASAMVFVCYKAPFVPLQKLRMLQELDRHHRLHPLFGCPNRRVIH